MSVRYEREMRIARAMELVWDSLQSHLEDTYNPSITNIKDKKARKEIGGRNFHIKTVKEYCEIISTLGELL